MVANERETEFLALLVHRGHLTKDQGMGLFQKLGKGGGSLDALLQEIGFPADKVAWLRRTNAGEQPEIPGYKIDRLAGTGGTSNVFQAKELKTGRTVAIKVLHPDQAANVVARTRFIKEAKLLIQLDHASVVKGFKVAKTRSKWAPEGPAGDTYFLVMEYVSGATLLDLIAKKKTFQEDTALFIVLQTAVGLEFLKDNQVVHRDIKPGNIMITPENRVKLIDLGFASGSTSSEEGSKDTTLGTVQYISPEQAQGVQNLDSRSDIYSLGVTLYHLVVGQLPFTGSDDSEILRKQIVSSLSSPVLKSRNISPHMHYFIEKMMAKEREIRYQDPKELIADIEETIKGKKTLEFDPTGTAGGEVRLEEELFEKKAKKSTRVRRKRP